MASRDSAIRSRAWGRCCSWSPSSARRGRWCFGFRRAEREERQQIKWLALAGATAAATLLIALPLYDVSDAAANVAILLSVLALPVATGIAVLRYRLYDIDVVINRALVYAALTATLARPISPACCSCSSRSRA